MKDETKKKSTGRKTGTTKKNVTKKGKEVTLKKDEYITPSIRVMGVVAIILAAIIVVIYGATMFLKAKEVTYSDDWKEKSYLVEKEIAPQISCSEIPNAILGKQAFVFVTYYAGEEEFELEKKLAKVIQENKLGKDFYVYPLIDNCGPIDNPNSVAGSNLKLTSGLEKVPAILFYREGNLEEVVIREDEKMLEVGDFQKLLDIYEITK